MLERVLCYSESMKKEKSGDFLIASNSKARRDYSVLESLEVGLVLVGCEVKSLRQKNASLEGSFARVDGDEIKIHNLYIAPYEMGNRENLESRRERKLLLHRSQIHKLWAKTREKGLALIPMRLYFTKRGVAKVELALAKGKKAHDRRTEIKKKAADREMDRAMKNRNQ